MAALYQGIPELEAAEQDALRRQKIAEAMMAQAQQPVQPFSQAGRLVVPMSWTQGAAQLAQAVIARKKGKKAEKSLEELAGKHQAGVQQALEQYRSRREGIPETTLQTTGTKLEGLPGDPKEAIIGLLANPYSPESARQAGVLEYNATVRSEDKAEDREARAAAAEAAERARVEAERIRSEDRRYATDQATAARRDAAAMTSEQRALDRAAQMERARMAIDAKREEKLAQTTGKVDEAKQRVSVNLKALTEYYDELDRLGATVDIKKSNADNLWASVRASAPGQLAGSAFGTEEQSYRNRIKQMQPLLLQEIRQATAMGARGLDSNKELEFYLAAATDPTRDLQANKAAIQVLENAYGLSSKLPDVGNEAVNALKEEFSSSAPQAAAGGVSEEDLKYMTPEERALFQSQP